MVATKDVVKRDLLIPRNPVRSMRYRADRHRTHVSNNTEGALGGPDVAFELLLDRGVGGRRARHRSVERAVHLVPRFYAIAWADIVLVRRNGSAPNLFAAPSWFRSRRTSAAARLAVSRPTSIRISSFNP